MGGARVVVQARGQSLREGGEREREGEREGGREGEREEVCLHLLTFGLSSLSVVPFLPRQR